MSDDNRLKIRSTLRLKVALDEEDCTALYNFIQDYEARIGTLETRCADLLKERNAWIATVELERSCVNGTHSYERIATLEAKLGEVKEALEWYSDGFKIMDHIDGTYTIHETWYQKARATLEEISK